MGRVGQHAWTEQCVDHVTCDHGRDFWRDGITEWHPHWAARTELVSSMRMDVCPLAHLRGDKSIHPHSAAVTWYAWAGLCRLHRGAYTCQLADTLPHIDPTACTYLQPHCWRGEGTLFRTCCTQQVCVSFCLCVLVIGGWSCWRDRVSMRGPTCSFDRSSIGHAGVSAGPCVRAPIS